METAGQIVGGRYRLVAKIETGGFADIYVGYDLKLYNRPIALKMLRRDLAGNEELVKTFLDEIMLTTRLQHENIVQVYDIIKEGRNVYLILELIDGPNLRKVLRVGCERQERLAFELSAHIVGKVCLALDYAHNKKDTTTGEPLNVIHRDITPGNILLSLDGAVKLSDFGIAKLRHQHRERTSTGVVKGTISYMSPEQVKAQTLDRRSDIYSLGIVMYEALTQEKLFQADTDFKLIQLVAKGDVRWEPILESGTPDPLKLILFKALEKNVSRRYSTAYEMYADLQRYLAQTEIASLPSRLRQFISGLGLDEESALSKLRKTVPRAEIADLTTLPASVPPPEGEEKEGTTVEELIRLSTRGRKRNSSQIIRSFLALLVALTAATALFPRTPLGRWVRGKIRPAVTVIRSWPAGATVTLDGRRLGKTPLRIPKVEAGSHGIVLALDGYREIKKNLTVPPKKPGQAPDTLLYSFQVPISVTSSPAGAEIYLNGQLYPEATPTTINYSLVGDSLAIELRKGGWDPVGKTVNLLGESFPLSDRFCTVKRVTEEGILKYDWSMNFYTEITLKSALPEAELWVDGEKAGTLGEEPEILRLPIGRHLIEVKRSGLTWEKEVEIKTGEPRTITAEPKREVQFMAYDETGKKISSQITVKTSGGTLVASGKSTPVTLKVPSRSDLRTTFAAAGYASETVSFDASRDTRVVANLSKREVYTLKITLQDQKTKKPVADALVYLTQKRGENPLLHHEATTKGNGIFEKRVSPGYYCVMITCKGYTPWKAEGRIKRPGEERIVAKLKAETPPGRK